MESNSHFFIKTLKSSSSSNSIGTRRTVMLMLVVTAESDERHGFDGILCDYVGGVRILNLRRLREPPVYCFQCRLIMTSSSVRK